MSLCVLPCSSTAPVAVEAHPGPLFRFHHSRPCSQCHLGGLFLPMLCAHVFSLFASELHLQSFQLFQFVHVFFLSFPGVAGVLRAIFPLSGIFFPQGKRRPHQTVPASIHGGQCSVRSCCCRCSSSQHTHTHTYTHTLTHTHTLSQTLPSSLSRFHPTGILPRDAECGLASRTQRGREANPSGFLLFFRGQAGDAGQWERHASAGQVHFLALPRMCLMDGKGGGTEISLS